MKLKPSKSKIWPFMDQIISRNYARCWRIFLQLHSTFIWKKLSSVQPLLHRMPRDRVDQFAELVLNRLHLRLSRRIQNALAEQIHDRIHMRPSDLVVQLNLNIINQALQAVKPE
jgi:hypothetical protein